ncbi:MAG: hypothetical protein ABII22_04505 [Candidatus Micrarchaeota archaeon]
MAKDKLSDLEYCKLMFQNYLLIFFGAIAGNITLIASGAIDMFVEIPVFLNLNMYWLSIIELISLLIIFAIGHFVLKIGVSFILTLIYSFVFLVISMGIIYLHHDLVNPVIFLALNAMGIYSFLATTYHWWRLNEMREDRNY